MKSFLFLLSCLITCSQIFANTTPGTGDPEKLKAARIAEAKADLEFHQQRVQTNEVLLLKAQTSVKYAYTSFQRASILHTKKALTTSEREIAEERYLQTQLNVQLIEKYLLELRAEVRGAQARLDQEVASAMSVPQMSHCRHDDVVLQDIALGCISLDSRPHTKPEHNGNRLN